MSARHEQMDFTSSGALTQENVRWDAGEIVGTPSFTSGALFWSMFAL
jgi:hypothetical protein